MALRKVGGLALWDFLDFIVRTRIPIFVLLRPFIQCKVWSAVPARTCSFPLRQECWLGGCAGAWVRGWVCGIHRTHTRRCDQLAGAINSMFSGETASNKSPEVFHIQSTFSPSKVFQTYFQPIHHPCPFRKRRKKNGAMEYSGECVPMTVALFEIYY